VKYNVRTMTTQFAVYIEKDEDGIYIGSIPTIPSCHAEGRTQEEMLKNLAEVLQLCLRNIDTSFLQKVHFVGIQNLDVSHA
jgi:predicted RNase H-like HicB family nuclease